MEAADASLVTDAGITVEADGVKHEVPRDMFDVVRVKEKVNGKKVVPHVIEPSHGLDRITYTVLEHSFLKKDDVTMLRLPPAVAPIKVAVFPLMARDEMDDLAKEIEREIRYNGVETYYDDSGSIGRRYARMDEVGTPWCITVDYQTMQDGTVTLRDRDSASQIRVRVPEVVTVMRAALSGMDLEQFAVADPPASD